MAMSDLKIERTIWIEASRERVWQAITDPKQIQQWFSPGTPWKLTALEVGGKIFPEGYEDYASTLAVVEPPRQFSYFLMANPPETAKITTTYMLEEENGGTRVTITETGLESMSAEAAQERISNNGRGYESMFENLKASIEGKALPHPEGF
jgi:uncharacterized protein YndB with AHSA1/START domain